MTDEYEIRYDPGPDNENADEPWAVFGAQGELLATYREKADAESHWPTAHLLD